MNFHEIYKKICKLQKIEVFNTIKNNYENYSSDVNTVKFRGHSKL